MSVLLLANVGHRDLLYKGEKVEPARSQGEWILDKLDAVKADLTTPLLSPVVQDLLRRHGTIQVALYGTDQPEDAPQQHRSGDTIHVARVVLRLLTERARDGIEKGWVKAIPGNPSLYDDMLAFFHGQLQAPWTSAVDLCYVYPVGGTPATNMGLMLATLERFGEGCRTLYLPEGETRPIQMDLADQVRRSAARRMARDRLRELSFGAAIPLLEAAVAPSWVADVARYARHRYHFDFEGAAAALDEAKRGCADDWKVRASCEKLRRGLLRLRDREPEALLSELYHNARLAWRRGEFAAFLGILFRFQEAALRLMVEELYPGLSTDLGGEVDGDGFETRLREREALYSYLQRQRVNGRPLRLSDPSRPVLGAMLRYAWDGGEQLTTEERTAQFRQADHALEKIDRLVKLRNKSIVAHGFEGVSEKLILDRYAGGGGAGDPLADVAAALETLGIAPGEDPFEEAARLALEGLT